MSERTMNVRRFLSLRIIPILIAVIAIGWFTWQWTYAPRSPPVGSPIATFSGGSITSSGVSVTEVFQNAEGWLIAGERPSMLFGWHLEVEVYQEGGSTPVRLIRYTEYSVGEETKHRWELSDGTTGGTVYDTWYDPDLPAGTYYLKIDWERCGWIIHILPIIER